MCDAEWMQFCNNEYSKNTENGRLGDNDHMNNIPECPKANDLYISTKSKIGYLNKEVDLSDIFWKIPILDYHNNTEGVIKKQIKLTIGENDNIDEKTAKYNNVDIEDISKKKGKVIQKFSIGTSTKDMVSYRCKKKGAFYNCFVIMYRVWYEGRFKEMHVKIFNTGKMEIPGVPKDDLLELVLTKVVTLLNSIIKDGDINIKQNTFETVLINSNFNCGFNINRELLVDIMKYEYKLCVSFDPCSYPGIMCKFYYYKNKSSDLQDGRLYKSEEESDAICISFMIFRTGSVLIVGKCDTEKTIYHIYNFIKNIFIKHYYRIYANTIGDGKKIITKRKKIKRKQIICYL